MGHEALGPPNLGRSRRAGTSTSSVGTTWAATRKSGRAVIDRAPSTRRTWSAAPRPRRRFPSSSRAEGACPLAIGRYENLPALVRAPSARGRLRHSHGSRTPRTPRPRHDDDLQARTSSTVARPRCAAPPTGCSACGQAPLGFGPVVLPAVLTLALATCSTTRQEGALATQRYNKGGSAGGATGPGLLDCTVRSVGRATQLRRIRS
jgi:hypothetical protein